MRQLHLPPHVALSFSSTLDWPGSHAGDRVLRERGNVQDLLRFGLRTGTLSLLLLSVGQCHRVNSVSRGGN